jgi:asparagine synthase (glutamine-hydrolysing)
MFNSLEVRCPLLDHRIAEYAFRHIPAQFKIRNGVKKYILKKIARKYLPRELELERKQGFDIPGDFLMTTYLADRLLEFPKNEYIERSYIIKLIEDQKGRKIYLWHKLFALYFFLRWLETWKN